MKSSLKRNIKMSLKVGDWLNTYLDDYYFEPVFEDYIPAFGNYSPVFEDYEPVFEDYEPIFEEFVPGVVEEVKKPKRKTKIVIRKPKPKKKVKIVIRKPIPKKKVKIVIRKPGLKEKTRGVPPKKKVKIVIRKPGLKEKTRGIPPRKVKKTKIVINYRKRNLQSVFMHAIKLVSNDRSQNTINMCPISLKVPSNQEEWSSLLEKYPERLADYGYVLKMDGDFCYPYVDPITGDTEYDDIRRTIYVFHPDFVDRILNDFSEQTVQAQGYDENGEPVRNSDYFIISGAIPYGPITFTIFRMGTRQGGKYLDYIVDDTYEDSDLSKIETFLDKLQINRVSKLKESAEQLPCLANAILVSAEEKNIDIKREDVIAIVMQYSFGGITQTKYLSDIAFILDIRIKCTFIPKSNRKVLSYNCNGTHRIDIIYHYDSKHYLPNFSTNLKWCDFGLYIPGVHYSIISTSNFIRNLEKAVNKTKDSIFRKPTQEELHEIVFKNPIVENHEIPQIDVIANNKLSGNKLNSARNFFIGQMCFETNLIFEINSSILEHVKDNDKLYDIINGVSLRNKLESLLFLNTSEWQYENTTDKKIIIENFIDSYKKNILEVLNEIEDEKEEDKKYIEHTGPFDGNIYINDCRYIDEEDDNDEKYIDFDAEWMNNQMYDIIDKLPKKLVEEAMHYKPEGRSISCLRYEQCRQLMIYEYCENKYGKGEGNVHINYLDIPLEEVTVEYCAIMMFRVDADWMLNDTYKKWLEKQTTEQPIEVVNKKEGVNLDDFLRIQEYLDSLPKPSKEVSNALKYMKLKTSKTVCNKRILKILNKRQNSKFMDNTTFKNNTKAYEGGKYIDGSDIEYEESLDDNYIEYVNKKMHEFVNKLPEKLVKEAMNYKPIGRSADSELFEQIRINLILVYCKNKYGRDYLNSYKVNFLEKPIKDITVEYCAIMMFKVDADFMLKDDYKKWLDDNITVKEMTVDEYLVAIGQKEENLFSELSRKLQDEKINVNTLVEQYNSTIKSEYSKFKNFEEYENFRNEKIMSLALKKHKKGESSYSRLKSKDEYNFDDEIDPNGECGDNDSNNSDKKPKFSIDIKDRIYAFDIETTCDPNNDNIAVNYSSSVCMPKAIECCTYFETVGNNPTIRCLEKIYNNYKPYVEHLLRKIDEIKTAEGDEDWKAKTDFEKFQYINERFPPIILAHNAKFDLSAIITVCPNITEVIGTFNNMKQCSLRYRGILMLFRDTLPLLCMRLDKAAESFGIAERKLPYPYDFYTFEVTSKFKNDNWSNTWVPLDTYVNNNKSLKKKILKYCGCDIKIYNSEKDMINVKAYTEMYNEGDVKVLLQAVFKFHDLFAEQYGVDTINCITIGAVANKICIEYHCYDGVEDLHGHLSETIRTRLDGGMVLIRDREVQIQECDENNDDDSIFDLDVNSEYPTAQCSGFPMGYPIFETSSLFFEQKRRISHDPRKWPYFIGVAVITNPEIKNGSHVSYVPVRVPGHGKVYADKLPKNEENITMLCDNNTYILLTEMQGLEYGKDFTIGNLIYWPGINNTIKYITQSSYDFRCLHKKTPLDAVIKLFLNNIWGKNAQRTYNNNIKMYENFDDAVKYSLEKPHLVYSVMEYKTGGVNRTIVTGKQKSRPDYKSRAHVAMRVLSQSKLILTSHIKRLNDVGAIHLYSDTDSIIARCSYQKLANFRYLTEEETGIDPLATRKLNGKNISVLGNLSTDFEIPSNLTKEDWKVKKVKCVVEGSIGRREYEFEKIYSNRVVIAAPKTYVCVVSGEYEDSKGDTHKVSYPHFAAKGIPKASIEYRVEGDKTEYIYNTYKSIANGEKIKIDCMKGVNFRPVYDAGICYYQKSFKRTLQAMADINKIF